jgi:phosphonate transport system ATP-binding protein
VLRLLVEAAAGRTLLLSTHQLAPVLPHFPRLVGLRQGRLLFDKPREAVTPADLAGLYQAEAPAAEPGL